MSRTRAQVPAGLSTRSSTHLFTQTHALARARAITDHAQ